LSAIGLYLYFAKLHVEVQVPGNSTRTREHFGLPYLVLIVNIYVFIGSRAQYPLHNGLLVYTIFFQLQLYEFTGKAYLAHIKAANTFYRYPLTFIERVSAVIPVTLFSASFIKTYLYYRVRLCTIVQGYSAQPIKHIRTVASACTTS